MEPAAKALMPSSSSSMNTGGTGMPEASAISSTTFSSRRSFGSSVLGYSRRPPSRSATAVPPPASWAILNRLPPAIERERARRVAPTGMLPGEVAVRAETVRPAFRLRRRPSPSRRTSSPEMRDHRRAKTPRSATWCCGGPSTGARKSRWPWYEVRVEGQGRKADDTARANARFV